MVFFLNYYRIKLLVLTCFRLSLETAENDIETLEAKLERVSYYFDKVKVHGC